MQKQTKIEVIPKDGCKVIVVHGDLEHGYLSEFSGIIRREIKRNEDLDLILDLDACNFLDSGNLGVISQANRDLTSKGHKLKLINVRKSVAATLMVTSLNRILDIQTI